MALTPCKMGTREYAGHKAVEVMMIVLAALAPKVWGCKAGFVQSLFRAGSPGFGSSSNRFPFQPLISPSLLKAMV